MIEVAIDNPNNYPLREADIEETLARVFLIHDVTVAKIGVRIIDEAEMTRLNENYKHHRGSTDVLTFPLRDPAQPTPAFLETEESQAEYGDIFLCYPVIEQSVKDEGIPVGEKIAFLTEHGALHLLGVHHD
jgi:probable rRNA maturation factor